MFHIHIYSAAGTFVNPLELYIFLHKCDPKHNQIFGTSPESRQREPNQTNEKKKCLCHFFILENDPILHMCELQKYVNILD